MRPRRTSRVALTLALAAATVPVPWRVVDSLAQTPESARTGLLMGVVVDPLDKRPVASAQVTLGGTVTGISPVQLLTDADGRFVFLDLPKGVYTITATRPGYADGAYGRRRPAGLTQSIVLREGERLGDLTIPIFRLAAITGTIRDEAGEPMVGVPVRALQRVVIAGRRKLKPGPIVRTDDRGVYRLGSLVPGEYVVAVPSTQAVAPESIVELYRGVLAGPPPPGSADILRDLSFSGGADVPNLISRTGAPATGGLAYVSLAGNMRAPMAPPGGGGRHFVYPTQFHPAAISASGATSIPVRSGEERLGVDLNLKLVPAVRVTGTVTGPSGPLITVVTLVPDTDDYSTDATLETATTLSDAAGRFTFIGVPPGQYRLRAIRAEVPPSGTGGRGGAPPPGARQQTGAAPAPAPLLGGYTLSATETLAVGSTDIDNLAITVRYGFRISGRAEFPNATTPVDPATIRRMTITLDPADGRPLVSSTIGRAPFNERGEFSSYQAPPGRYYLQVNNAPPGWTLKHATWNGRDVSNVPIQLDRDASEIRVVFTERPSTLSGQVQTASGAPDPTATVLVFPADSGGWTDYGEFPRRLRALRTDRDGRYQTLGLPAGDYLVVAVLEDTTANWQDPATLKALARLATAATLTDDETRSLTLRTMAVSR